MRKPLRPTLTLVALLSALSAGAAEVWDAPAFTVPAAQLLQAAKAIKRERATEAVVLLDERTIVLDEQRRATRALRLIYRVDSPAGVERWAATSAQWQPWYQAKPVIRARVIGPDGTEHQIDQKLLSDAARSTGYGQIFDDSRTLHGPMPAVAVGAVVEMEITVRDEKPSFAAGTVTREFIGGLVPVLLTRITVDAPQSLPLKHLTQLLPKAQVKESRISGRVRLSFEQGELDEITEFEAGLPPDEPSWANVQFSSGESWEAVAATYRELTEERIRNDDAKPLLAGLKVPQPGSGTREYIAALVGRLHREVRYTGIQFGDSRLVPTFPAETLRRKFGDCKDKSTLLVAALRASGIDAYLALLSAADGQDVSPGLPGLGLFDHAIVYVPGTPDLWIDATAEYTRVGTLPAAATNRLALVIRAGEKDLTRTPEMRSVDNREVQTLDFHLQEHGPSRAIEATEVFGTIEDRYRGWYSGAETKERRQSLDIYAERNYRAQSVTNYVHTSSNDFSKPYSMRVEMKDAQVGSTDLSAAAVRVRVSNITARLPDLFKAEESRLRKSDVVFEPFVTEWRYRIHPPVGFKARQLPADAVLPLGPAQLKSEFLLTADGAVHATWRFDTMKGRYTPAESEALRKALRELDRKETTNIVFDQVGLALFNEGKYNEALKANQALVAKYPRKAVYRLHSANALQRAGLGSSAQREALAATKLEPDSARAWHNLGWMLQHDAVGRFLGEGYDRIGAIAAFRKARALAPADSLTSADLAGLLEYDANGSRYSPFADLDESIRIWKERRSFMNDEDARADAYSINLPYAMLYARRYQELLGVLREQPQTERTRILAISATAGEQGSGPAIELARSLVGAENERYAALTGAGELLFRLREYSTAADLFEAGSGASTNTAATTQRIAFLRKTRRDDGKSNQTSDPRGVTLRWYAELLSDWTTGISDKNLMRKLVAPGSEMSIDGMNDSAARRTLVAALARQEITPQVAVDMMFSHVRVNVDGNDSQGYRVQLRTPGITFTTYVVSINGEYRILAVSPTLVPLANKALERVDANDLAGARQWLDWARAEVKPVNSDDPLKGPHFSRAWTVGAESNLSAARIAAVLLSGDFDRGGHTIPLLLSVRDTATSAADKVSLDVQLAWAYHDLQQWPALLEVANRLVAAAPDSPVVFRLQQKALIHLKQWDAAETAARARLARLPLDSLAFEMLLYRAEERGTFDEFRGIMQPLFDSGRASANDYNQYAWAALLRRPVDEQAVEAARTGYEESQGKNYAIGHTLACAYAATGKPREARDLLLTGMEQNFLSTPNDENWFGFGLVAEAYGETGAARDYYSRVKKPKTGPINAASVYAMSQARLAALSAARQ